VQLKLIQNHEYVRIKLMHRTPQMDALSLAIAPKLFEMKNPGFTSRSIFLGAELLAKSLEVKSSRHSWASEAGPGIQDSQAILDPGFRRDDGIIDICK
jgi:hypothetical protein